MTDRRRVVLVDDEARIVQGLQRALRSHRETWDVATATSGPAALELFGAGPVDLVISDMRMPDMDGAELLAEVKRRSPETMRIVLSGQTEHEAAFRALSVAHQFLSKPTDPAQLGELLARTVAMRAALPQPALHAALGELEALPTPRATRRELETAFEVGADAQAIAAIVERDPALALKLLQTVNSAFFGLRQRICDIGEAVAYLGIELVKRVCALGGTTDAAPRARAAAVATLARRIAGEERGAVAYAAALLSSIGRMASISADLDVAPEVEASMTAYLLDLWGVPGAVVDALRELPNVASSLAARTSLTPADAVWIAQCVFDGKTVSEDDLARLGVKLPKAA